MKAIAFLGYFTSNQHALDNDTLSLADNKMQHGYIQAFRHLGKSSTLNLVTSEKELPKSESGQSYHDKIKKWIVIFIRLSRWSIASRKRDRYLFYYNILFPHVALAWLLKLLFGIKIIPIAITLPYEYPNSPNGIIFKAKRNLSRILVKKSDAIIAITAKLAMHVCPDKPSLVINGGFSSLSGYGDLEQNTSGKFTIVYTGTLYDRYHIRDLISAINSINDVPGIVLKIYGRGPLKDFIEKASVTDKRISYCGVVNTEEMQSIQSGADLLVALLDTKDKLAHYSFPSKIFEYLLVNRLMLVSNLDTIPSNMTDLMVTVKNEDSPEEIANAIRFAYNGAYFIL